MAVLFNGRVLITPTVETAIDDTPMYPNANPYGNVLALIGECDGGTPKRPTRLRSTTHAKQLLRSGPLYDAALRAFAPSSASGSPAQIWVVRVDPAVQSSLELFDASGNLCMTVRSTDYGNHTKSLELKIDAGSKSGYKIQIRQDGVVYATDNVGAHVLDVAYTGAAADASVSVSGGLLHLEAPIGNLVRSYTLFDWNNAAALAESIDGLSDWDCTVKRGQERFKPERLDRCTGNPKGVPFNVNGDAWKIAEFLGSAVEILLDVELEALPVRPPVVMPWTQLAGGTNGNVVPTDWEDALAALHEAEVHWIVPLTEEPSIWDMVVAHVEYLSSIKRERRAFIGAGVNVVAEQAMAHALAMNSDRVGYVWPGVYRNNAVTRKPELLPAYMAAVNLAAAFAAMNPGTTMSRKPIAVAGVEVQLREPTDTDALVASGVIPLVQTPNGVIVSQAVSTWQLDDRYNRREISTGAATDYVARAVRAQLEMLLGTRGSPFSIPLAVSRVESILKDLARQPPLGSGILVGDAASPPYRNIQVELDGDILRVAFECSPVIPINYILVGLTVSPYSGTTTTTV